MFVPRQVLAERATAGIERWAILVLWRRSEVPRGTQGLAPGIFVR